MITFIKLFKVLRYVHVHWVRHINIRRCIEHFSYQIGMIIVEEIMTYEVIANPMPESCSERCFIVATCMSIRKVGVAGRFDLFSRDSPVP